jgi:hypothetical protein
VGRLTCSCNGTRWRSKTVILEVKIAIESFENVEKLKRNLTLIFDWKHTSLLLLATFALGQVQQSHLLLVSVRQEFLYGPGSSVCIVTCFGLDDWKIGVRFLAGTDSETVLKQTIKCLRSWDSGINRFRKPSSNIYSNKIISYIEFLVSSERN